MSRLQDDLADVFFRHGHPSYEEPGWAAVVGLQVLILQNQEKMMSSIQDLADNAKAEAAALVDLNNTVVAMSPPSSGGGTGTPGGTSLTAADQTLLDTANDTIVSNIAKIGEIKTALGQPAVTTPPVDTPPSSTPPASTPVTPIVPPVGGPPQS